MNTIICIFCYFFGYSLLINQSFQVSPTVFNHKFYSFPLTFTKKKRKEISAILCTDSKMQDDGGDAEWDPNLRIWKKKSTVNKRSMSEFKPPL